MNYVHIYVLSTLDKKLLLFLFFFFIFHLALLYLLNGAGQLQKGVKCREETLNLLLKDCNKCVACCPLSCPLKIIFPF